MFKRTLIIMLTVLYCLSAFSMPVSASSPAEEFRDNFNPIVAFNQRDKTSVGLPDNFPGLTDIHEWINDYNYILVGDDPVNSVWANNGFLDIYWYNIIVFPKDFNSVYFGVDENGDFLTFDDGCQAGSGDFSYLIVNQDWQEDRWTHWDEGDFYSLNYSYGQGLYERGSSVCNDHSFKIYFGTNIRDYIYYSSVPIKDLEGNDLIDDSKFTYSMSNDENDYSFTVNTSEIGSFNVTFQLFKGNVSECAADYVAPDDTITDIAGAGMDIINSYIPEKEKSTGDVELYHPPSSLAVGSRGTSKLSLYSPAE